MEKTRMGLQHIGVYALLLCCPRGSHDPGKLAYAQFVELGSPPLSRGLPPDLAAWEPSLDFGVKTMDVATASYVSGAPVDTATGAPCGADSFPQSCRTSATR